MKKGSLSLAVVLVLAATLAGMSRTTASPLVWEQLTANEDPASPPSRASNGISAWDSQANRLLVFGGHDAAHGGSYLNDLWEYTTTGGWKLVTANGAPGSPHIRTNHTIVWDSQANRLLVFGGFYNYGSFFNDLWEYSTQGGWKLLTPDGAHDSPARRDDHIAVWDSNANRLLVFGGVNYASEPLHIYNDLWEYTDADGWKLLTADGAPGSPPGRDSCGAAWDSQLNRLLVFGGSLRENKEYNRNDLWEYTDTGGWNLLTPDDASGSPPPRQRVTATWDSQVNRLLVFGGTMTSSMVDYNDLWEYTDARGWKLLSAQDAAGSPSLRRDHTTAWDSQLNRLLVFGGYSTSENVEYNDLWQFQDSTPIQVQIDIKPGSNPNCFNRNGNGVIPVAILGSAELDVVDIKTDDALSFNGLAVRVRGKKGPLCSFEYADDDEYLDLVCHFEDDPDQWVEGTENEATLTGELIDGTLIEGTDAICIVP